MAQYAAHVQSLYAALYLFAIAASSGPASGQDASNAGQTFQWRTVASMLEVHESSGVKLLPDGRVLVAGGHADNSGGKWRMIESAEVYDPASDTWTKTGNLVEVRQGVGDLTLLSNGKVLLAGEHDSRTGAELYDPATGTWSATGRLLTGRGGHTTTLLADGRVLVAGGIDYYAKPEVIFASAELYDPESETWSVTTPMANTRFKHKAVRLASGEVLVTGGTATEPSDDRALAIAELYDPASGTWRETGSMLDGRETFAMTLLRDGRVLVAGGSVGHFGNYTSLATAEIYDPESGTWSATGAMAQSRTQTTLTLLPDGRVLAAAGVESPSRRALNSAEIFDPETGRWSDAGNMRVRRWNHRAVLLPDGSVLIVGGYNVMGQLPSVELLVPRASSVSDD